MLFDDDEYMTGEENLRRNNAKYGPIDQKDYGWAPVLFYIFFVALLVCGFTWGNETIKTVCICLGFFYFGAIFAMARLYKAYTGKTMPENLAFAYLWEVLILGRRLDS